MGRRGRKCLLAGLAAAGMTLPVSGAAGAQGVAPPASPTTTGAAVPGSSSGLTTSLLSPRRLPGWLDLTVADQRLSGAVAAKVQSGLSAVGSSACLVVNQGSRAIYAENPSTELIPASNVKILTAMAALDKIGANDHFETDVLSGVASSGGTVRGDLYLRGGGDPVLRTNAFQATLSPPSSYYTSLDALAAAVRAAGVTVVTGNVVGDESRYDDERAIAGWKPSYAAEDDVGPLSALDVNEGFIPTPTTTTTTTTVPPTTTTVPRSSQSASKPGSPSTSTTRPPAPTHQSESGSSTPVYPYIASPEPALTAASTFVAALRAHGVTVEGGAESGTTPADSHLVVSAASPTVGQIVDEMLTVSDDTTAELLLKEIGYRATRQGTTSAGLAEERSILAADGLPVSQMSVDDGSGLDRADNATCTLLADALQKAGPNGVLAAGLPVAGRTGTLLHRLVGTPAVGRVRAKTGTLDYVSSLSGFVTPDASWSHSGALYQPLVFSVIVNGLTEGQAESLIDGIVLTLATYPQVPSLAEVGPQR